MDDDVFTPQGSPTIFHHSPRHQYTYKFSLLVLFVGYSVTWGAISLYLNAQTSHTLFSALTPQLFGTGILFFTGYLFKNGSFYTLYWGSIPLITISYWGSYLIGKSSLATFAILLFVIYFLEHSFHFLRCWEGLDYEGHKTVAARKQFKNRAHFWIYSLFVFYLFPTFVDYLSLLPVYYYIFYSQSDSAFLVPGLLLNIAGVVIKGLADYQLAPFKNNTKIGVCTEGVWKYSRHPDYFGEIIWRWGLYLIILGASPDLWWTGSGALLYHGIVYFYSIPMLENRLLDRWPTYVSQIKIISRLVFWFRKDEMPTDRVRLLSK